jgi:hypothetical protein
MGALVLDLADGSNPHVPGDYGERPVAEIPGASLRVWSGEGHSASARHLDDILLDLIDATDGER